MELRELTAKIEQINTDVQNINNTRLQNLGKKETLETQLNNLIASYNEKYGANLQVADLDATLAKLMADKEVEFTKLEQSISLIKEGKFAEAEKNMGIVREEPTTVEAATETNEAVASPTVEVPTPPTAPVVEVAPPTAPVETPVVEVAPPIAPVAPETGNIPASVAPVTPPVAPPSEVSAPVAPPTEAIPTPPASPITTQAPAGNPSNIVIPGQTPLTPPASNPSSFGAIFGGTSFSIN